MSGRYDAVVVGAGPNGLTAAAMLARAGRRVLVFEAAGTVGGGARTDESFGSGVRRDLCSAVHPTGYVSPAFLDLDLEAHGLRWVVPEVSVANVSAAETVALHRDAAETVAELGADGDRWLQTVGFADDPAALAGAVLELPGLRSARGLAGLARFGSAAGLPVDLLARAFRTEAGRTMFAGIAAHAIRPLSAPGSAAAGLLLGMLTRSGWPVAQGGSQAIVDALAAIVVAHGGVIETGCEITDSRQLPSDCDLFFDTSPRVLLSVLGDRIPRRYARALERYEYGGGVCKADFVLSEPIPWRRRPDVMARTATFHIADDVAQIRSTERDVARGVLPERPWLLGGEPTRVDASRAPDGTHLAWAYCHVPAGCDVDVADRIVAGIERVAPGLRDTVIDRKSITAAGLADYDANYIGGDINCGAATLRQLALRPVLSSTPQSTGAPGVYLCSSATAPGGGVHGMSGYRAARTALAGRG